VEEGEGGPLLGLGLFKVSGPSRLLPLKHLKVWRSIHSFLDGLLLDRDRAPEAAAALFSWVASQRRRWHGISFVDRTAETPLARVLDQAASGVGSRWQEDWGADRAWIPVAEVPEDPIQDLYPAKRRKRVRRARRRLEKEGEVSFRLDNCRDGYKDPLAAFLRLEAMGWKGEGGSAFVSDSGQEKFAKEVVAGLAPLSRVIFSELLLDGDRIAMGMNFRAGETLFGFKIGWNTDFAAASPGMLADLDFLCHARSLDGITTVDGCAMEGSWLETLWPWRFRVTSGVYPTTLAGRLATAGTVKLKGLKRMLRRKG